MTARRTASLAALAAGALLATVAAAGVWDTVGADPPVAEAAPRGAGTAAGAAAATWVDAWAAAPHSAAADDRAPAFEDQTLRLVVPMYSSGTALRLRLSNTFGDRAVTFGRVRVGLRAYGAALVAGTDQAVAFGGAQAVTVRAGGEVMSDPVPLEVGAGQELAVSMYLPKPTGPATWHRAALRTNYLSGPGDHTATVGDGPFTVTERHWFFLTAVAVRTATRAGAVVALGDSITDGAGSTLGADHRWPDFLARRLLTLPPARIPAVLNEGISGNKVLTDTPTNGVSALRRLDRDVLARRGAHTVILLEGINDIRAAGGAAVAEPLIAAYREIIDRAHARGLRVIGGTLTPIKGSGGYTAGKESARQRVNTWIRTGGAFDGVADFDRAVRDPADPLRLLPAHDSGDHLHPGDAGYRAMAAAVDLALLSPAPSTLVSPDPVGVR